MYECYEELSTRNGYDLKNKILKAQELPLKSTNNRLADILTELIDTIEATSFDKLILQEEKFMGRLVKTSGLKT